MEMKVGVVGGIVTEIRSRQGTLHPVRCRVKF